MRLGLKAVRGILFQKWAYTGVSPLNKTLDRRLFKKQGSYATSTLGGLSRAPQRGFLAPLGDVRNFARGWLSSKRRLTPLVSDVRKTIAGVDHRLVRLKTPRRLHRLRRMARPRLCYTPQSYAGGVLGLRGHFCSIGGGWGVKSSQMDMYLGLAPWQTLAKPRQSGGGFLTQPTPILPPVEALFEAVAGQVENLAWEPLEDTTSTLIGLLSEDQTVRAGSIASAYLDDPEGGEDEDPNAVLVVEGAEALLSLDSSLEEFYEDYAAWVGGFSGGPGCRGGFSN